MPKKLLFNDDDDQTPDADTFKINKSYASSYSRWRTAEELQAGRLTAEDLESSDSDSSWDEYANPENPEHDRDFLIALAAANRKGPMLDDSKDFWKDSYAQPKSKEKEKEKVVSIRDLEREKIMKKIDKDDSNSCSDEDDEMEKKGNLSDTTDIHSKPSTSFGFCDDDISDNEEMFKEKEQPKYSEEAPKANKTTEFFDYLKGKRERLQLEKDEKILKNLKNTWTKENISAEDRWIRDFFLNQKNHQEDDDWDDERDDGSDSGHSLNEEVEAKYNFRFEEPDSDLVKTFPRKIENTLRVQENRRKQERERVKERRKEALEKKKQELKQLRAERKKELLEKQQKIFEAAGMEYDLGNELDEEFDPDKYDAYMAQKFNETYETKKESKKPNTNDSDLEDEAVQYDYDGYEQYGDQRQDYYHQADEYLEEANEQKIEDHLDQKFGFSHLAGDTLVRFQYVETEPNNYGLSPQEIIDATTSDLNSWVNMRHIRKHNTTKEEEEKSRKTFARKGRNTKIKMKVMPSIYGDVEKNHEEALEKRRLKYKKKKEKKQRAALRRSRIETKIRIETEIEKRRERRLQKANGNANNNINTEVTHNAVKEKKTKKPVKNKKYNTVPSKSRGAPPHKKQKLKKQYKKSGDPQNKDKITKISDLRLKGFNLDPKKFKKKARYGINKPKQNE